MKAMQPPYTSTGERTYACRNGSRSCSGGGGGGIHANTLPRGPSVGLDLQVRATTVCASHTSHSMHPHGQYLYQANNIRQTAGSAIGTSPDSGQPTNHLNSTTCPTGAPPQGPPLCENNTEERQIAGGVAAGPQAAMNNRSHSQEASFGEGGSYGPELASPSRRSNCYQHNGARSHLRRTEPLQSVAATMPLHTTYGHGMPVLGGTYNANPHQNQQHHQHQLQQQLQNNKTPHYQQAYNQPLTSARALYGYSAYRATVPAVHHEPHTQAPPTRHPHGFIERTPVSPAGAVQEMQTPTPPPRTGALIYACGNRSAHTAGSGGAGSMDPHNLPPGTLGSLERVSSDRSPASSHDSNPASEPKAQANTAPQTTAGIAPTPGDSANSGNGKATPYPPTRHRVQPPENTCQESSILVSTTAGSQADMSPKANASGERIAGGSGQLQVVDAFLYIAQVKSELTEHPAVYSRFLDIMQDFKAQTIDTAEVIRRVSQVFQRHKCLILGFNTFLPPGYKIELRDDLNTGCITTGFYTPGGNFSALAVDAPGNPLLPLRSPPTQPSPTSGALVSWSQAQHLNARFPPVPGFSQSVQSHPHALNRAHNRTMPSVGASALPLAHGSSALHDQRMGSTTTQQIARTVEGNPSIASQGSAVAALTSPLPLEPGKLIELDQAVNYVNRIKSRFQDDEAAYKRFLDVLQTYEKDRSTIKKVHEQVSELFREHSDLLSEFFHFLPEEQDVSARSKTAQHASDAASVKKPTTSTEHRAKESRPTDGQQHFTLELEFFEEFKAQLGTQEYEEIIKFISLVAKEIIIPNELLKHIDGYLGSKYKHLTKALRYFINHNGPISVERALNIALDGREGAVRRREQLQRNPRYQGKRVSDLAQEFGENISGSYARLPSDIGRIACSGMSENDRSVLNFEFVARGSKGKGHSLLKLGGGLQLERYIPLSAISKRPQHNLYDKGGPGSRWAALEQQEKPRKLDVDDQRYEFDLLIGCIDSALNKLQRGLSLEGADSYPLTLIYGDTLPYIEAQLAAENSSVAVRIVMSRLETHRSYVVASKKQLEALWSTKAYGPTARRFNRTELVDELHNQGQIECTFPTDSPTREFIADILWHVCEWILDTPEQAENVQEHVARTYKLLDLPAAPNGGGIPAGTTPSGEVLIEQHVFTLLRLHAEFARRVHHIVKRPSPLPRNMIRNIKAVLDGAMSAAEFEKWATEMFENEWEHAAELPKIAKRFSEYAIRMPERDTANEVWKLAVLKTKGGGNEGGSVAETKYEKMAKETAEGEMLVVFKWNKMNGIVKFETEKQPKKRSTFIRYVEKVARKRRRMVV